jgi:hypothetical protein
VTIAESLDANFTLCEESGGTSMKFEHRDWAIAALIVVGGLGLALLLGAGHFFWPMALIIAGAYIVPTLYVKLRKLLAASSRATPTDDKNPNR